MIIRIWRGWTSLENAQAYQDVLTGQVIPMIKGYNIPGFRKIESMRREVSDEVEFSTIMWFESLDDIRRFAGDDYETAHVPEIARAVLKRWDARAVHYTEFYSELSLS